METGTDGRFYDSHYDFDHDGYLNCGEQLLYEKDVFGDDGVGASYTGGRKNRNPQPNGFAQALLYLFLELVMITMFVLGGILMIGCPPIGAILLYCGFALNENLN